MANGRYFCNDLTYLFIVELLKEHDLGRSKYVSLKMPAPELGAVTDEEMEQYQKELEHFTGLAAEVCRV